MTETPASSEPDSIAAARTLYASAVATMEETFKQSQSRPEAGEAAIAARAFAVDRLVQTAWNDLSANAAFAAEGMALIAVGGYGRQELFPCSDVDLMVLLDAKLPERAAKEAIRRLSQMLWDSGLRASIMTRTLAECERFDPENVEFTLSLLDARYVAGDAILSGRLNGKSLVKLVARDGKKIAGRLLEVTRGRHAKYGSTLFHLEPNVKECPGGLRDVHVCTWLHRLGVTDVSEGMEFVEARRFMTLVRVFLHLHHGRDDNTLDWEMQDKAALSALGVEQGRPDAAYWMRLYFRHARSVERRLVRASEGTSAPKSRIGLGSLTLGRAKSLELANAQILVRGGLVSLKEEDGAGHDPAENSLTALDLFAEVAHSGSRLSVATETRLEQALPSISANLEDGPVLWLRLSAILEGRFAGSALRAMHGLGLLELLIPEFHGIDALVIRDAYHRYTVDEHTFVVIDTLHQLPQQTRPGVARDVWAERFGGLLRDLPHRPLLYLAALLHDVGKGHAGSSHAAESARMARHVLDRLELDALESGLVLDLIRNHLEMSATLRRDVFDSETIRGFAARVPNPEALRMLTLFTYADIAAVHPDALTPWKAENLWRLYIATANYLDRTVDEERVVAAADPMFGEVIESIAASYPDKRKEAEGFLGGFPRRYLQTRTPEQIRTHFQLASGMEEQTEQLDFRYAPGLSELTLITQDRPMLFASMAGVLAAWGMNIVTADAFSNAGGIIVDSFRFTDTFKTLEMNVPERSRFVESVRSVMSGALPLEPLLAGRRRGKRSPAKVKVETRVDFDDTASTHSTLLQVLAQDVPGLLRVLSLTIARHNCNIEVALIDTEGEMAIDVFYLTLAGAKISQPGQEELRASLLSAIEGLLGELYN